MSYILAVDPGKKALAWALFADGGLGRCGLCRGGSPLSNAMQLSLIAKEQGGPPSILVVEGQRVYPFSRIDANDLLPLAECVGAVKALLAGPETSILHPLPQAWKGSTKGDVFVRRTQAVLKARPQDQRVMDKALGDIPKSLHHNVYDAYALGLYGLGIRI